MERITEQPSKYRHLEKMLVDELITSINREDQTVALAIEKQLPQISKMITAMEKQLKAGGRMFYLEAGSTRMKCGTVQKMLFDMIGTTVLIRMGRVEDNRMVNVRLINNKVVDRSVKMLIEKRELTNCDEAKELILKFGNVKKVMNYIDTLKQ